MLTVAFMAASCAKDDLGVPTNSEGHPVRVTLNMGMSKSTDIVVTRADNSYSDLGNLYLFVYGNDGKYQQMLSTTATDSINRISVGTRSENDNGVTYPITINTTSGTKNLLAVANTSAVADEGGFWSSMASIATDAAAGNLSFEQLKAAVISLREDLYKRTEMLPIQIVSSTQMLISGVNEGVVFGTNGNITKYGQLDGTDKDKVVVKMDRAMARITFNIAQTVKGAKGTFVPSSYRVYNIPTESVLTNTNKSNTESDTYINSAPMTIGNVSGGNYTFSFYMPENIPEANENASIATYQDRDKWSVDKGSRPENKKWTNAPQNSTFVVISGTYSQSGDTTDKSYTGNVSYTIHLGDFSNNAWSNFNVERNYSYTYKMSVKGVDNIVVEAEKEGNEQQPGAEGQIFTYDASTYSYELDAHYEQVFLEYNLSTIAEAITTALGTYAETKPSDEAIDNAIADNLILVIQSEAMDYTHATATDAEPYTVQNKRGTLSPYRIYANAVRNADDPAADKEKVLAGAGKDIHPTKGFDYKWVEFWPQTGTNIAAYPGVSEWSREDISDFSNKGAYGETVTEKSKFLKDVYDVIVAMGKVVKKIYKGETVLTADRGEDGITITQSNNDYVARFTAFVNEYYYYRHPLTGMKVTSWSVMTNKIPREMIIAMSSSISQDGNSSYSQIYSYITQASIQTFYNSRVTDINGFGIETYNETPHITFGTPKSEEGLSKTDGRSNQITLIGGLSKDWNTFIASAYNGWTKSVGSDRTTHKLSEAAYKTSSGGSGAYYACLSRNRDLNGNGVIDNNEIRWYLPSLNEYIRIGVGSNAISNAAQLYMGDKMNMKRPTYSWSYDDGYPINYIWDGALYYTSSNDDERVYWAVERGSYSKDGENWGGGFAAKPIRCIRSLPANTGGFDISSVHVASDASYVAHNVNGSTVLEFKGRLVDELYRERTDGVLIPHDEDDNANSYYDGIIVAKNYLGTTYTLNRIINSGDTDNPCRDYHETGDNRATWRVPNLAELSAMNAAGLITQTGTACRTQFSNQNVRFGYGFNGSRIYCYGDKVDEENLNSYFPIRCVRDVPEGYVFPQ